MSFHPFGARAPDTLRRSLLALSLGGVLAASAAAEPVGSDFRMQVIGTNAEVQPILEGDYGAAITDIENAPGTLRTLFSNTNNLCVAYTLSGDFEHAEVTCNRALKIARRQNRLWYNDAAQRKNLATALSNRGVLEVFRQLRLDDPGNFDEARRFFEEAVALRVSKTEAAHNLKLLQQSGGMSVASAR